MSQEKKKLYRSFGPTNFAVDNAISMFLLTGIILLFGAQSYLTMPKEAFPEIVIPTIFVGTTYSGNSAEDMEKLVTIPLEKEIGSISGIKSLEATSIQDFSNIIVEFNTNVDVDKALREVKDAVDKVKGDADFPQDLTSGPDVEEINFSEFPILTVNISGRYTEDELRQYGEYLQDEIEKLSEISEVNLKGTSDKEVKIDVDWFKMQSRKLSFNDIANAISAENLTLSAGDFKAEGFNRSVRVVGEFKDVKEMENIIIRSENQNPVFLKDIATVRMGFEDPTSIARSDQLQVVSLDVIKRSGENLLDASDKIKELVEKAQARRFPSDLKVQIFNDQSVDTRNQVSNLQNSIISGIILVVLVLLFFLGLRNALFVGLAIPMSMFLGILILNLMGVTLNMIVLFSLILALGMLVDNSIVVVENVFRYVQEGYSLKDASKKAAGEVAMPIISSTATTLAAFFPLLFWPGLMGEFMGYLPLTLIIVLISSLFVALVLTPVFTAVLMTKEKTPEEVEAEKGKKLINNLIWIGILAAITVGGWVSGTDWVRNLFGMATILTAMNVFLFAPGAVFFQDKFLPILEAIYDRFISFALKGIMPYVMFLGVIALLFLSVILMGVFPPKVEFFPAAEPKYVNVFVDLPIGSSIEATNELMKEIEGKVEAVVRPYNEKGVIEAVLSQIGENTSDPSGPPEPGATPNKARLTVSFVPADERQGVSTTKIMEEIRQSVQGYAGVEIVVDRNQEGPPTGKPINLEISGDDVEMRELSQVANTVLNKLRNANVPGVEELKMNVKANVQQDLIQVDREAARRYGLSTYDIAMTIRTSLYGREVSKFKEGEDEYPIMLRFSEEYRKSQEALMNQNVTFRNMDAGGQVVQIPISSVAKKVPSTTYNAVKREDEKRTITIYSNVLEGYNANEVVQQLQYLMEDYELPEGYDFKFTGEQEEQAAAMEFLSSAFTIAILAIFLILVSQFNSLSKPFIIILSVFFSTIGVLLGYIMTGMDLVVIMTGIGIISLAGVVVNNAIVLIDYTDFLQKRRKEETGQDQLSDEDIKSSIIEGGKTRLRPVLLTAITTVLGLIPLAVGFNFDFYGLITELNPNIYWGGDNAAFWGAMSWTVVYGLIFATFLTLVIVPVMYWLMYKLNSLFSGLFGSKKD
ncbi:efflux RND transporter permease subunit [Saprospira sp. CCB-QB6]|uniref:efflux RND transporter permease subunit n=1 Tax=Saprospira sp. CCB-QB6 TaxID=3023936 RepID=UPI00234AEBFE|nr:efflux RND transporter permease subunit [Saprospira sp. CCB-QB6]WCL80343.1 efflux RND transporter permease subunit [Saprospira sp. CCB-QB6]